MSEEIQKPITHFRGCKASSEQDGQTNRADLSEDIRAYWNFREELSEADGIILKGVQIVIPVNMRKDILS